MTRRYFSASTTRPIIAGMACSSCAVKKLPSISNGASVATGPVTAALAIGCNGDAVRRRRLRIRNIIPAAQWPIHRFARLPPEVFFSTSIRSLFQGSPACCGRPARRRRRRTPERRTPSFVTLWVGDHVVGRQPMPELVRISRLSATANTAGNLVFEKRFQILEQAHPVHGISRPRQLLFCHDCNSFSGTMVIFGKFVIFAYKDRGKQPVKTITRLKNEMVTYV